MAKLEKLGPRDKAHGNVQERKLSGKFNGNPKARENDLKSNARGGHDAQMPQMPFASTLSKFSGVRRAKQMGGLDQRPAGTTFHETPPSGGQYANYGSADGNSPQKSQYGGRGSKQGTNSRY